VTVRPGRYRLSIEALRTASRVPRHHLPAALNSLGRGGQFIVRTAAAAQPADRGKAGDSHQRACLRIRDLQAPGGNPCEEGRQADDPQESRPLRNQATPGHDDVQEVIQRRLRKRSGGAR